MRRLKHTWATIRITIDSPFGVQASACLCNLKVDLQTVKEWSLRRIVLSAPRRFEVEQVPVPSCGPGEALVRIGLVGVCGSDMHLFRDGRIGEIRMTEPLVIGHECMGTIEDTGPGVNSTLVGQRVAVEPSHHCGQCDWCRAGHSNLCPNMRFLGLPPTDGAMAEFLSYPVHLLEPISNSISDEAAVILEPMAVALHAVRLAKVRPGHSIVVLGVGVLGCCVMELLKLTQGLKVVCVDLLPERLDRALRLGANAIVRAAEGEREEAVHEVLQELGGMGASIVFECSGAADTLWNMAEVAAPGAHVAVIGTNPEDRIAFSSGSARRKGLTIRFVRRSLNTLKPCLRLAEEGLISPHDLVTHCFPGTQSKEAFELVDCYEDGVLKAVVDMTL